MVVGKIGGYLAIGLIGAFLLNALARPQEAIATGAALESTGQGIGGIGAGIGDALRSIGSGSAKLFDPLFTLRDLAFTRDVVYDSNVSGAANVGPVAQVAGETNGGVNRPSSSTITWSSGTTASVPSLSPAAKSFYAARGVSVT
jgi:hypothetical protein